MKEKFLPIGSVCMLKGGTKRVMITGYLSIEDSNPKKIYDYNGCIYPEGYLSSKQVCLFNHDQIDKVFFEGYTDEERDKFNKSLDELSKALEKKMKETV